MSATGPGIRVDASYHYPPELLELLTDAIPALVKSKQAVIDLFVGAGVPYKHVADWSQQVRDNRESVRKHEIARSVLCRLNDEGDVALGPRREIIRRISTWEDFSTCYDNDRYKAMGLVSQIQKIVEVKDSFTRMAMEREKERKERQAEYNAKLMAKQKEADERRALKDAFYKLFSETNPQKRGKALEPLLNGLFRTFGILVKEAFEYRSSESEGVLEQIDGVIEFGGHLYLVEMKWWKDPIGVAEISPHLVRLFGRPDVRGMFISASGFTDPAIRSVKDALAHKLCFLCDLKEIVMLLEQDGDLVELLQRKTRAAQMYKEPFEKFGTS
jgi:restriction system protein